MTLNVLQYSWIGYLRQSFARIQNLQRFFLLLFPYLIRRPLAAPHPHSPSTSLSVCPSTFPRAYFMPLKSGAWRRSPGWHTAPLIPLHIAPPFRSIHPPPHHHRHPATLASFVSWWGVTALPLSGQEFALTESVCVCVCSVTACSYVALHICVCVRCVCGTAWPTEVTDIRIVLSQQEKRWFTCQGGWGTRRQIQRADKCAAAGEIMQRLQDYTAGTYTVQLHWCTQNNGELLFFLKADLPDATPLSLLYFWLLFIPPPESWELYCQAIVWRDTWLQALTEQCQMKLTVLIKLLWTIYTDLKWPGLVEPWLTELDWSWQDVAGMNLECVMQDLQ